LRRAQQRNGGRVGRAGRGVAPAPAPVAPAARPTATYGA
jgi:hypothetical protein